MKTAELEEVADILQGGRQGLSGNHFVPRGYPAYGAGGLNGYLESYEFDGEAVILSSIGARCGKCFFATGKWSSLANTQIIHPDPNLVDARFLWFQLNDERRWPRSGTGQPFIKPSAVKRHRVLLPNLSEQRRIADRLERVDRLRRTRRYALELTDTFLPAVFLKLFGDPVQNVKGWPVSELEELATVERGKFTPRPRNDPSYFGGRFPFIQTGDISNSKGRLFSWTQTLNEKGTKVSRSFLPGTIVIAIVGATIGITSILEVEVYCPDSVVGIQVNPAKVSKEYLEFLLRFWRPVFLAQAPETARANINLDILRPLQIPVPPLFLQQKFTDLTERVEKLRLVQRESLRQAEHLFSSLLHRAFSEEPQ